MPRRGNLKELFDSLAPGWLRLPTSRVQAGWRSVHWLEDDHIMELRGDVVEEQLKTAKARLGAVGGAQPKDLVERITSALKAQPDMDSRRALLREADLFRHNDSDTEYEDMAAILAKAVLLTILVLGIVAGLGVLLDRETYFLFGAAGALLSRLTRVLRRKPKASDYGASWSTLILSPAGGALAGWLGVVIAAALSAAPFDILDDAFAKPWDDALSLLGFIIAFVAGFSERLFTRLVGTAETRLAGQLPEEEAEKPS